MGNILKISNRLKKCAKMVDKNTRLADIGTDHAYLPIYLILENKINNVLACDVRNGPLQHAMLNIKKFNLEQKIETRISNGLLNINENEVDEVLIAGMGGLLICDILKNCKWNHKIGKKFILQPMNHEKDLRIYLSVNGYKIEKEEAVVCNGKSYIVIKSVYTGESYKISEIEKYIGKLSSNNNDTIEYINKQLRDLNNRKYGAIAKNNKELELYYANVMNKIKNYLQEGFTKSDKS